MRYLIIVAFIFISCGTEPPEEKEEECENLTEYCCIDGERFTICHDD